MPSLLDKSISVIQPVLEAAASGDESIDKFRWGDAAAYLAWNGKPWKSPDLDADWQDLLAQKPGPLRDILLSAVLRQRLSRDFASAIKTEIAATGARFADLESNLHKALPKDPQTVLKFLPDGDPMLIELWVKILMEDGLIPQWSAWAEQLLDLPAGARRDAALARVTRLWLQHNPLPAREWPATLQDAAAKAVAEREVQVSEIIAQASESWIKAYDSACAMADPDARRRALLGVFKAGAEQPEREIEARAHAAAREPGEAVKLQDAWVLGLIDSLAKKHRRVEQFTWMLRLRDPALRRDQLAEHRFPAGFDELRKVIQESGLEPAEKRALLQSAAISKTDDRRDGIKRPDEPPGFQGALNMAMQIEDPRLRFIQQRSVVHEAVRRDGLEALHLIETANIDAETRARLMKEWQRVSQWHVPKRNVAQ
jgi:hypothetical protein